MRDVTPNKRRKSRSGSTVVEFALTAPLLVLLLGGAMDFSRVFYVGVGVTSAARAALYYGLQDDAYYTDYAGMQAAAIAAQPYISGMTATATRFCEDANNNSVTCTANSPHQYLDVTTSANYNLLSSYIFLPASTTVTGRARIRFK